MRTSITHGTLPGARPARLTDWNTGRPLLQVARIGSFPWFQDEFVHPDDLEKSYNSELRANLTAGFVRENAVQSR